MTDLLQEARIPSHREPAPEAVDAALPVRATGCDGPGWAVAAVLFAAGIALGAIITGSPVQERIPYGPVTRMPGPAPRPPGGFAPVFGPALFPFYTAALALPLFLWMARRAMPTRAGWRRTVPLWAAAVVLVTLAGEVATLLVLGAGGPGPNPVHFLVRRFVASAPLVLGSVALALAIEHRRRAHAAALEAARAREELAVARLRALSAQLRPHFLFNTLQTVSTLLHSDVERADGVIGRLGELLQASLRSDQRWVVPLDEELRITGAYLDIARERFGQRLRATVEVAPGTEGAQVPPFLLQPLVENAVQHGIERSLDGGRVEVHIGAEDGMLVLRVDDDGEGAPAVESEGIGLGNTRRRLHALYADRAGLSVEARPGGGTRVTIRLPPTLPAGT
ncbi:MAG TPA: histidine kinase [Longimicrobium sp.]|nr:histidine kinase [Longimicrobium sp.]